MEMLISLLFYFILLFFTFVYFWQGGFFDLSVPYHALHCVTFVFLPYSTLPYPYPILHLIISYHTIKHYTISYHTISYHIIPYHTIPYHTIPSHILFYYTKSYPTLPSPLYHIWSDLTLLHLILSHFTSFYFILLFL